jgi:hypothetical protein
VKPYPFLLTLIVTVSSATSAQQIPQQSYQDSVLGWMKVYRFTGVRAPVTVDAKRYSPAQLSIGDSLATWIQASYAPRGALGDVIRSVSARLGLYNKNDASLPQTYGAYAKTYTELKYDPNHKMVPFTNSHLTWSIQANMVFGEPLLVLNTPTQYYFLLPGLGKPASKPGSDSYRYDLSGHPAVRKYITYFNDQLNSTTANATYVLLAKDNKLPFVTVSKGEYLDKLADAIARKRDSDRASGASGAEDRYQKRMALLADNRVKYGSRLGETATAFSLQPDVFLENYKDVFEGNGGSSIRYAVYKVNPAMSELAKTDKPQWIVVWWDGDLLNPVGKQQIDAITNNFDFQYLYDYFFAPEKVKGRQYRPLH